MGLKKKRKIKLGTIVNYLLLALLAFVCLYPFLNVLAYSVSGYNAVLSNRVTVYPIDFTLEAYRQILGRTQIWMAMRTTVLITLVGTLLSLVLTVFAAYALSRQDLPGRKVFTVIILFTMYFGGGMIPTFLVVKGVGLYDMLGALFIPQSINVFNFIVMRTFFRNLPESLEEAARIDGASPYAVTGKNYSSAAAAYFGNNRIVLCSGILEFVFRCTALHPESGKVYPAAAAERSALRRRTE